MNHTKNRTTLETTTWKSSLLNKEDTPVKQNPLNYFDQIVIDNDSFGNMWEHILLARDRKELPAFHLKGLDQYPERIGAFIILVDRRGVHLICPLFEKDGFFAHELIPLQLDFDDAVDATLSKENVGAICIDHNEYLIACSRGFENASNVLLGGKAVELKPDYRVVAGFHIAPPTSH